jgi:hypothetical protein
MVMDIFNLINNSDMSKAEKEYAVLRLVAAIGLLGGGVAYVETGDGFKFLGCNFYTPQALIKAAALQRDFGGMSLGEALNILAYNKDGRYAEISNYLTSTRTQEKTALAYKQLLLETYCDPENFAKITAQYEGRYNLTNPTSPENLPLEVLQYVIDMAG